MSQKASSLITPDDRRGRIAAILAKGVRRYVRRARTGSTNQPQEPGDSANPCLDSLAETCPTGRNVPAGERREAMETEA